MAGLSNWLSLTIKLAVKSISLVVAGGRYIWLFIWIWLVWLDHFRKDCFDQKSTVDEENDWWRMLNRNTSFRTGQDRMVRRDENGKDEDGNKKDENDEDEDAPLQIKICGQSGQ